MAIYGTHELLILRAFSSVLASTLLLACGNNGSGGGGSATGGSSNGTGGPGAGGAAQSGGSGNGTGTTGGSGNGTTGGSGNGDTGGSGNGGATSHRVPGTEHYDCSEPSGTVPPLQLVEYASGFNNPVLVTHAPNDAGRLFVVEQPGVIRVVKNGTANATPFLDIQSRVAFGTEGGFGMPTWEQGLLGLAFHPDYAQNGLLYVHYTSWNVDGYDNGTAIIAEFEVNDADPDVANPASERIVLTAPTIGGFHNGGTITFGSDGMLYIALGDGAGINQPGDANGQNVTNIRAGVSRINPLQSGGEPYTVPTGNLHESMPNAARELWSYGLRNPYRMNFDGCTGALYIGDVGQSGWEEINIEPAGAGHRNYGWAVMEGPDCYQPPAGCDMTGLTPPNHAYPNEVTAAVIGGAVYRGSSIPALKGSYFFTDLYGPVAGGTRRFVYDPATETISDVVSVEDQLNPTQQDGQGLVAIQNGGDGELYFLSRGEVTSGLDSPAGGGVIYRLQAE